MTAEEIIKLVLETRGVEGLKELGTEAIETAKALATVAEAADKVEKKTLDLASLKDQGMGLFSAFQSGEIPQIIQGVGGLVELVPALNTFAPAIKKIGEVSEYAWPLLKQVYAAYTAGNEDLKKTAKETEDYGERVDELGESVKNLTDHTASLNAERERGNKLLEAEASWVEKLNNLRPEDNGRADAAAKERAENLSSVIGGKQDEVVEGVSLGMATEEDAAIDEEMRQLWPAGTKFSDLPYEARVRYDELRKRQGAMQRGIPKDIQEKARKTTAGAVIGGKEEDVRNVLKYLPKGSKFRQSFKNELPEEKEIQEGLDQDFQDDLDKRAATVKARDAFDKKSKELTAQGKENEEHMRAQQEHDKEAESRETEKKYQQSLKEAKELEARQNVMAANPTRRALRQIQTEGAAQGFDMNPAQALQEFKRRTAESSAMNAKTVQTMLEVARAMKRESDKTDQGLDNVRSALPKNRTASTNGFPF